MTEHQIIALVGVLAWLVLAGSALFGGRVSAAQGVRYAIFWAAIFAAMFLAFTWLQP